MRWIAVLSVVGASLLDIQAQAPTFHTSTNLQTIAVEVTDKSGNLVTGLTASDFKLLEDGRPQKIAFFGAERQPLSLTILLDTSRSMEFGHKLDRARALLAPLLRRNRPEDEVFLMPFTDVVGKFVSIAPDQRAQPLAVSRVGSGGSAVYDAVATALCRMRTAANRRQAIIVITDGVDESSRLKLDELADLVAASTPEVFIIGLYDQPEYQLFRAASKRVNIVGLHKIDNPLAAFPHLSKESGAEAFFPRSEKDLEQALDRIDAVLESQYTLAYYPQHPERNRKIEVRLKRRDLLVSTRARLAATSPVFRATECEVSAREHPLPWESHLTIGPNNKRTYHDDFKDSRSGWPNFGFDPAIVSSARYTKSGYQLYRAGIDTTEIPNADPAEIAPASDTVLAAYGPWWTDFKAFLTLEEQNFDGRSSGGLVTNVNENGYFALLLRNNGKSKPPSYSFVQGLWGRPERLLVPWKPLPTLETPARRHALEIESGSGRISLFVDGNAVGPVYTNNAQPGLVGFGVFGDGRLVVHDLRVESLP